MDVTFSFSDTIAGYVTGADKAAGTFTLKTTDGREYNVRLAAAAYGELVRNLGESYADCTGQMRDMLTQGRYLYAYGTFYPEAGATFDAMHLIFVGRGEREFSPEKPDWWVRQIQQLGDFYYKAQFGDGGKVDYRDYHTMLDLYGRKIAATRQETDTISRLIYGFASAYMLTGDEKFLDAAEKGTEYLREHFCAVDTREDTCYWYHAVDFAHPQGKKILGSQMAEIPGMRRGEKTAGGRERKMLSSEFGDDWDAIPAYEQIYALAGPTQTYRITGDRRIRKDIDRTLNLFERYFKDYEKGGYFSHIDPITFDPRSDSLGRNRARKNWNSVGDHAPAYLINLWLATGEKAHLDFLIDTATTIATRFPDYDNSAFVQEKFHEDWSPDREWGWQQNRAVVGHNLKIAWNLMRVYHVNPDARYLELSEKIAELMPKHGGDPQRGGWYDVVERELKPGQTIHRYAFHDRKAWWQQEQGILAYLILAGSLKKDAYQRLARESAAFYNAFFLDHDSGAVYFNVLANGLPFLLGTERNKGSHSMSGYHSFELCYLAATYTNLLITKQPLDLYFKPKPGAFADNILRVSPDILPKGSIVIDSVTVNGQDYADFDAEGLTVKIPESKEPVKIRVRVAPSQGLEHFAARLNISKGIATLVLTGDLESRALPFFRQKLNDVISAQPKQLVLDLSGLNDMSTVGARALIFAKQKLDTDEVVVVKGANQKVKDLFTQTEFAESVSMTDK